MTDPRYGNAAAVGSTAAAAAMSGKSTRTTHYTAPATDTALREWRQLMIAEVRLRERIHHQHRLIIADLETRAERAEMRDKLNKANHLLAELKTLLGEAGAADVLGHGR